MTLDLGSVGSRTDPFVLEYDFKNVVLYALGVGAQASELDYLYEGRGPRVLPTFAIVPSYAPVWSLFERVRADMSRLVHSAQVVRLSRPLPPAGRFETVGTVEGIYDMKRFAQVVLSTRTTLDGEPCCETEWTLLVRDAGGFGGARPPKSPSVRAPDREPDFALALGTTKEQALLYRLSGDLNPLHADPDFAREAGFAEGPILHGLASYGIVCRAVVAAACGGDASRIKAIGAQFRRPIWPGESLRTHGYVLESGRLALEAFAGEKPDPVITNAWVELEGPPGQTKEA